MELEQQKVKLTKGRDSQSGLKNKQNMTQQYVVYKTYDKIQKVDNESR